MKFHPQAPYRIWDTRLGAGGQAMAPGETRTIVLPPSPCEAFQCGALDLNVTVTNPTAASHLSLFAKGDDQSTSNLNFNAGQTIANHVIVQAGDFHPLSIYNNAGWTDVIIDVLGAYEDNNSYGTDSGLGDGLTPIAPTRMLDTRSGVGGPA